MGHIYKLPLKSLMSVTSFSLFIVLLYKKMTTFIQQGCMQLIKSDMLLT